MSVSVNKARWDTTKADYLRREYGHLIDELDDEVRSYIESEQQSIEKEIKRQLRRKKIKIEYQKRRKEKAELLPISINKATLTEKLIQIEKNRKIKNKLIHDYKQLRLREPTSFSKKQFESKLS